MDVKTLAGLERYRDRWPGDVILAAPEVDIPVGDGERWFSPDDLGIGVASAATLLDAVRQTQPDLVLASLTPRIHELEPFLARSVVVAEFTPEDLASHELAAAPSAIAKARVRVGAIRRARAMEQIVRRARALQCNGYPAFERLGPYASSSLLFFDTRLTAEHVEAARRTPRAAPARPARLCFSGRLIHAKGPEFAVQLAADLADDVELTILGSGGLADDLKRVAGPNVRFGGHLDFDTEWTRWVTKEIDLMVLPHVQGDPSGTYLEAAGCGVPLLGFGNVALQALVGRHGLGWTAPVRDQVGLNSAARKALGDPVAWAAARAQGLEFMAEHHVDAEYARRVDHLISLI